MTHENSSTRSLRIATATEGLSSLACCSAA